MRKRREGDTDPLRKWPRKSKERNRRRLLILTTSTLNLMNISIVTKQELLE